MDGNLTRHLCSQATMELIKIHRRHLALRKASKKLFKHNLFLKKNTACLLNIILLQHQKLLSLKGGMLNVVNCEEKSSFDVLVQVACTSLKTEDRNVKH
jgi:hypothetical protein